MQPSSGKFFDADRIYFCECGCNLKLKLTLIKMSHTGYTATRHRVTWTIKARDARRILAAEMKYMRRTAGYTWTDYKTNTQIAKEFKINPILEKLQEYKRNWIQYVNIVIDYPGQ
jgi:hypothetical protein